MLLVPAVTLLLVLVTGATEDAEDYSNLPGLGLSILGLAVLSYLLLNGYGLLRNGQTLGKKLLGIAITRHEQLGCGNWTTQVPPLWRLICIRALFFPLLFLAPMLAVTSILTLPWLIAALPVIDQLCIFTPNRRTLHDRVTETVVTRRSKPL